MFKYTQPFSIECVLYAKRFYCRFEQNFKTKTITLELFNLNTKRIIDNNHKLQENEQKRICVYYVAI